MSGQPISITQRTASSRSSLSDPLFGILFGVWWGIITQTVLTPTGVSAAMLMWWTISADAIRWMYLFGSIALFVLISNLWLRWDKDLYKIESLDRSIAPTKLRGIYRGVGYISVVIAVLLCTLFVVTIFASSNLQAFEISYGPLILTAWAINDYIRAIRNAGILASRLIQVRGAGKEWT